MKRWLILLCLTLIMGCGGVVALPVHYLKISEPAQMAQRVIPVWVDADFGEADRVAIQDALNQWNYVLNGYIRLDVQSWDFHMEPSTLKKVMAGDGWAILKINGKSKFIPRATIANTMIIGFTNRLGGNLVYVVRDRMQNEDVMGLVLHEIGHLLGSGHNKQDLMGPKFNWAQYRCVDKETAKNVATYQHLPTDKLNYCVYGDL